jgi:hypothetical protein
MAPALRAPRMAEFLAATLLGIRLALLSIIFRDVFLWTRLAF